MERAYGLTGILLVLVTMQEQSLEKESETEIGLEKRVEKYMEMPEKEENGMSLKRRSEMRKMMKMSTVKGLGMLLHPPLQALHSWTLLLTQVETFLLHSLPPSLA
jgi:hypothetical protein